MVLPVPSEMTATVGQILTAAEWNSNTRDGINFLLNKPKFVSGVQTSASSPASGSWAQVFNIGSPVIDNYSGWASGVYYAPLAGWYTAVMTVAWSANSTGSRGASFAVNSGTLSPPAEQTVVGAGTAICVVQGVVHAYLTAGQYLRPIMLQTSGAALSTVTTGTMFTVDWDHA